MTDENLMPTTSPSAPEGARCAEHPLSKATRICARCGNYMCAACAGHGSAGPGALDHCRPCAVRFGTLTFPFNRNNWTVEGVCNFSFGIWKQHWAPLAGVSGLGLVAMYGMSIATSLLPIVLERLSPKDSSVAMLVVTGVAFVVQFLVQTWIPLAMFGVSLHLLKTGRVELDVALRTITRLPHALLQALLIMLPFAIVGAVVGGAAYALKLHEHPDVLWKPLLWASPLIGVALYFYLSGLLFVGIALVDDPPFGPLSSIEMSMRTVALDRSRLTLMAFIMGATVLAGLLLCCVGIIFSMGLANVMLATLYLALKDTPARAST